MKKILFFLAISFCTLFMMPTAFACDPLGCLFGGHNQDTLILGEVMSAENNTREVKIFFIFPQNQVKTLKEGEQITLTDVQNTVNMTEEEAGRISVGKKYLMSLNQQGVQYAPAWGIYEITGTTSADAQLVENEGGDDAALQIFINSGGTENDFYFDGEKAFLRADNGQADTQIYPPLGQTENDPESIPVPMKKPGILWYGIKIGTLIVIAAVIFFVRKKGKHPQPSQHKKKE